MDNEIKEQAAPKQDGVEIVHSPFKHFKKNKELINLKGTWYRIQNVSPKKIILRLHARVKTGENIPEGCFTLKKAVPEHMLTPEPGTQTEPKDNQTIITPKEAEVTADDLSPV